MSFIHSFIPCTAFNQSANIVRDYVFQSCLILNEYFGCIASSTIVAIYSGGINNIFHCNFFLPPNLIKMVKTSFLVLSQE